MATRSRRRKRTRGSLIDGDGDSAVGNDGIVAGLATTTNSKMTKATAAALTTTGTSATTTTTMPTTTTTITASTTTTATSTTTIMLGKENKRIKSRKVAVHQAPSERSRLQPATMSTTMPPISNSVFEMFASVAMQPEAEMMNIKVEPFDVSSDVEDYPDTKPDVQVLQQEILRQQQQQQQQLQTPFQLPLSLPLLPASPSVTGRGKRVYIIGDMATLTSLANSTNNGGATLPCLSDTSSNDGGDGVDETVTAPIGNTTIGTRGNTVTATTPATTTILMSGRHAGQHQEAGSFEPDEFDGHHSDTDEEGYSDIVFDEDEDDELVEDEEDMDQYDPPWSDFPMMPRLVFPFDRTVADIGMDGRPKSTNPTFYFEKMIGNLEEFCSLLAAGANERVRQLFGPLTELVESLHEISSKEIRIFLALCLQMSTMRLPTLSDYWNDQAHYNFGGFADKMPFDRFKLIMRVFNFENMGQRQKPTMDVTDAFSDVRPLFDYFNQRMTDIYKSGQRLVINQPVIFWRGQCHWLQNMSEKFRCNAIVLHFLTEHTGLLLHIVPDVERPEKKQLLRNSKQLAMFRSAVTKELLQDNLGHGHTAYLSKYYSSYGLASELACHRTYATGLLDPKRYGNCKELVMMPVKRNEFAVKYSSPLMMGKWRRNEKCVYFYSSDCLAIYANETSRRSRDPRPKIVKELEWQLDIPLCVRDAMIRYQMTFETNEVKWDKQLAIYIFNLIMLNAYILYTMYAQFGRSRVFPFSTRDISQLKTYAEFRQHVIADLLTSDFDDLGAADKTEPPTYPKPKKSNAHKKTESDKTKTNASIATAVDETAVTITDDKSKKTSATTVVSEASATLTASPRHSAMATHISALIPREKGKVMKKKCRVCRKLGMLTFSKSYCVNCPSQPGLCETPCFKIWHDQLERSISPGTTRPRMRK